MEKPPRQSTVKIPDIPYEGELDQTDAFIPFQESGPQKVTAYPADKTAKIFVYCRSGRMSAIVAQELMQAGYTNVWNLDGGFSAWEQAGYTVIHK
jgi:rhodanese-related sulfurtransferase